MEKYLQFWLESNSCAECIWCDGNVPFESGDIDSMIIALEDHMAECTYEATHS